MYMFGQKKFLTMQWDGFPSSLGLPIYMQGQSPQAIPLQATMIRISRLASVADLLSILWLEWFVLGGLWSKISGLRW